MFNQSIDFCGSLHSMNALLASNQTNLNNYICNSFMKYSNICNLSIVKVFATFFFLKFQRLIAVVQYK